MAGTILNQAVIMLLLIIVGMVCYKIGLISENGSKELSKLVLTVVNPMVILMAYQTDFNKELLSGLLLTFVLSAASFVFAIAVSYLVIRDKKGRETDIERFSSIYSNCAFMGIPLINALMGYEGVFYLTAFITIFNILVWTHGVIQISGVKSLKSITKAVMSPSIFAVVIGLILFLTKIRFPVLIAEALDFISSMNTPLAMLVAGATIAQTNMLMALKKPRIYIVSAMRLLVIPLIIAVIFRLIPLNTFAETAVLVAMAAPSAAICTLQCLNYGKNSLYASEIFAVTTLLSVATMPLIVYIYQMKI